MEYYRKHLAAIQSGKIDRSTVIGLRKGINTRWRLNRGYSVGFTTPKPSSGEMAHLEDQISLRRPIVTGALHETGVKLLNARRYKKRLQRIYPILDDLQYFRLIRFDRIGSNGQNCVPVYRAVDRKGRYFDFRNIPWQSGGQGPELLGGDIGRDDNAA